MANYTQAFELLLANEGGYNNDPQDPGGETYKGVARKMHSKWDGWIKIDMLKRQSGFPANLDQDTDLQSSIFSFYRVNFWDKMNLDLVIDQEVGTSIFDFAVNAGINTSASLAQLVVGASVDGVIGPDSIEKLNGFDKEHFLSAFTVAKIARYITIVKKRPTSKKYFYGWVCRALGDNT